MKRAIAALIVVVCLALPGAAPASVTIGLPLYAAGDDVGIDCGSVSGDCVLSPAGKSSIRVHYSSPVNGTVLSWRAWVWPGAPYLRLRAIAAEGTFAGSGSFHPFPQEGPVAFPESMPISIGNRIGVEDPNPGYVGVQTGLPGLAYSSFIPGPDGSPAVGTEEQDARVLLSAVVEPTNTFTVVRKGGRPNKPGLLVTAPNPGLVRVEGIRDRERNPKRITLLKQQPVVPGTQPLVPPLTPAAHDVLKKDGKAKGTVSITYTPTYGRPSVQVLPIVVKRRRKP